MTHLPALIDQVEAKDTELLDWAETEVISIAAHPFGWEIMWAGEDNEPAQSDPVLFRTESIREALAQAKARQEAEMQPPEEIGVLAAIPDIPETQQRFVTDPNVRVDDAGGD